MTITLVFCFQQVIDDSQQAVTKRVH